MLNDMIEEEKTTQVIDFSFQMKDWDEPMSDQQLVRQVRFHAIRVLNLVACGKCELSEEIKASISVYNKYCHRVGLDPLDVNY